MTWTWCGNTPGTIPNQLSKLKGRSLEEIVAENAEEMKQIEAFRIIKSETLSDDQMLLHLHTDGKKEQRVTIMKKIDDEWKIDSVNAYSSGFAPPAVWVSAVDSETE